MLEPTCSSAIALKEHVSQNLNTCLSSHPLLKEMYNYGGILVGTPKLHPRQLADIQCFLSNQDSEQLPSSGQYFTKLQKTNDYDIIVLFRIGETIIIKDHQETGKEWVASNTLHSI